MQKRDGSLQNHPFFYGVLWFIDTLHRVQLVLPCRWWRFVCG